MTDAKSGRPLRVGLVAYGLDRPAAGIARYAVELVRALRASQPGIEPVLLQPFADNIAGLDGDVPTALLPGATRRLPGMMLAGPFAIAAAARRLRLDVVHDPTGIAPFVLPRPVGQFARVVTIHDMIPFVHPETHATLTNLLFRHYIPRTLPFVDHIVTVSEASKRDIERFYEVPSDRITVASNGVGSHFAPRSPDQVVSTLSRYGVVAPYLLTVGALQARKNLEMLFEAFARLRADGLPHRLVVVGPTVWKSEGVFRRLDALGLGDAAVLTGFVEDADLPALYAGAACFVFPSIYEGFGLPPLEAMACGATVVASNSSSLPEVVGDAAITVDPHDVAGFTAAIERVVNDPVLAEDLRHRGLSRAKQFTWERAAAAHAELYRSLVAGREAA